MEIINDMIFLWSIDGIFYKLVLLFFCFFIVLTSVFFVNSVKNKNFDSFITFFILSIFNVIVFLGMSSASKSEKIETERKKAEIEQQKFENFKKTTINRMCFKLDVIIESNLKKDNLKTESISTFSYLTSEYLLKLKDIKNNYFEKYKNSNNFSDNRDLIEIYSLNYKNFLKIIEEIEERKIYCYKNYCNSMFYDENKDNYISYKMQEYIKFQCKE